MFNRYSLGKMLSFTDILLEKCYLFSLILTLLTDHTLSISSVSHARCSFHFFPSQSNCCHHFPLHLVESHCTERSWALHSSVRLFLPPVGIHRHPPVVSKDWTLSGNHVCCHYWTDWTLVSTTPVKTPGHIWVSILQEMCYRNITTLPCRKHA